jgi:cytochrome c-type biogenesis protein CcmH
MVARYGEFVRYRPSMTGATAVLWLAPLLLLVAGAVVTLLALRSRRDSPASAGQLSPEEQQRLQALLGEADKREAEP